MSLSRFSGQFRASDFAYGINTQVAPLQILSGPSVSGSGTLNLAYGYSITADGIQFTPLNTNSAIEVGVGTNYESVTPSAVSDLTPQQYGTASVTATFTYAHGGGYVRSGTVGLQEAINYVDSVGGGTVIVDSAWTKLGGTAAILNAATLPSDGSVQILDLRGGAGAFNQTLTVLVPNASVLTLETVGVPLIPAPGAGNVILVEHLVVEQVALTAAFAGSPGVITAAYGTQSSQVAATGSIAATVLTNGSGTTNQIGFALGVAPAVGNTTVYANAAVGLYCATNNPTTGGGSLIVKITYRTITGF